MILLLGVRAVHNGFGLNFTPSILSVLKWDMIIKDPLQSVIPETLEMVISCNVGYSYCLVCNVLSLLS